MYPFSPCKTSIIKSLIMESCTVTMLLVLSQTSMELKSLSSSPILKMVCQLGLIISQSQVKVSLIKMKPSKKHWTRISKVPSNRTHSLAIREGDYQPMLFTLKYYKSNCNENFITISSIHLFRDRIRSGIRWSTSITSPMTSSTSRNSPTLIPCISQSTRTAQNQVHVTVIRLSTTITKERLEMIRAPTISIPLLSAKASTKWWRKLQTTSSITISNTLNKWAKNMKSHYPCKSKCRFLPHHSILSLIS